MVGVAGVSGGVAVEADGDRAMSLLAWVAIVVVASVWVGWRVDRNTGLSVFGVLMVVVALMVADRHDTLLR